MKRIESLRLVWVRAVTSIFVSSLPKQDVAPVALFKIVPKT